MSVNGSHQVHRRTGSINKAIEDLTEAIQLDASDTSIRIQRALTYTELGAESPAINDYLDVIRSRQNSAPLENVPELVEDLHLASEERWPESLPRSEFSFGELWSEFPQQTSDPSRLKRQSSRLGAGANGLTDLERDWHERFLEGEDVPPEELCLGRPDLVEPLRERIKEIKDMNRLMGGFSSAELAQSSGVPSVAAVPPTTRPARSPGDQPFPGYRLRRLLGRGGFGEAWEADSPTTQVIAIKFVYGNLLVGEGQEKAHLEFQGLQTALDVRHPLVLEIRAIEQADGELMIVSELADCSADAYFSAWRKKHPAGKFGSVTPLICAALSCVRDVAEALDYMLGTHNLQHLDVKPSNLLMVQDRCKLGDFGTVRRMIHGCPDGPLAVRLVTDGDADQTTYQIRSIREVPRDLALGRNASLYTWHGACTPDYAPPEIFSGHFNSTFDQYSLAVTFCQLVTGHLPFPTQGNGGFDERLNGRPELSFLPAPMQAVVRRALHPSLNQRFRSCLGFVQALFEAAVQSVEK